jgi:hypothetical protein
MDINLNIDEYELNDLLNLFKLDFDFSEYDLKQVKKMVLKTHPDKSGMDKQYFLFFSEAYKIIYSLFQFRHKSTTGKVSGDMIYVAERDDEKEALLAKLKGKSNFNALFNELFDKYKLKEEAVENGYGDWLKSDEDVDTRATTMAAMNESFQTKKNELRSLVKIDRVEDMANGSYDMYDLSGSKPEYYSSGLFSALGYEDLKKAHVESVIPVTHEDYLQRPKYNTVDELQRSEAYSNAKPLSFEQSKEYLEKQKYSDSKNDIQRAFKLAKQDEEVRKKNEGWMSHFKKLQM